MAASFENLYTAKIAYNLGGVDYRCLVCKLVHNSRERSPECEKTLRDELCKNLLEATRHTAGYRRHVSFCLDWELTNKHTSILWRVCEVEPYWLMLKTKMPIIHEILDNRLTEEEREILKIRVNNFNGG